LKTLPSKNTPKPKNTKQRQTKKHEKNAKPKNTKTQKKQDRALQSGWKAPKKANLEHEMSEATGHRKHSRLSTYLVHHAREHLGEPVGQKQA
jgi:hypothetical protein